ncbi:MAG: M42 family metallopeptidase [candidate division WOR-3 bacterium]|nr:MAG: M42 family metallopeptidase [candidate division WOR-3 bacterium]
MGLIEELCNAYGPAGREHRVRKMIEKELKGHCAEMETDRLGNLIAHKPAVSKGAEKIMLCAHMDEIGLIVTHIDMKGFIRFTGLGGIFTERILGHRVIFENGTIGIIGMEPDKDSAKPSPKPRMEKMYIDVGTRDLESTKKIVEIGDIASFHQIAIRLGKKRISAKALDDRIGCYCLIEAARRVKKPKCDVYFVFTVQEEVGLRGARTGAYSIDPTYAIAVDVTDTGDTPEAHKMQVAIGGGVAVKVKDSGFIANPVVKEKLVEYAEALSLPYQMEILEHGSTDAAVIQLVRAGVMSGVLSIPTRYIHTTSEVCDLGDVEAAVKLLVRVCEKGLS